MEEIWAYKKLHPRTKNEIDIRSAGNRCKGGTMTDNYAASASVIGRELGKNRTEMTKALLEHDLITGKPGTRELTDKGKAIGGMVKSWDNGYGGFAARG